jgi:hypothetical protein
VRGVVGRAELLGKQPGQRLHLITTGVEREFLRVGLTDMVQAFADRGERFFPVVSRAGEYCFIIPEAPLAQSTPLLIGCSGFPWINRTSPSSTVTLMPQRQAHM